MGTSTPCGAHAIAIGPLDSLHISYYIPVDFDFAVWGTDKFYRGFISSDIQACLPRTSIDVGPMERATTSYIAASGALEVAKLPRGGKIGSMEKTEIATSSEIPLYRVLHKLKVDGFGFWHLVYVDNQGVKYATYRTLEDGDTDVVLDMREQGPGFDDEEYDGNNDGFADWTQGNVTSFDLITGDYVTMA